jgi:hypothetical protein
MSGSSWKIQSSKSRSRSTLARAALEGQVRADRVASLSSLLLPRGLPRGSRESGARGRKRIGRNRSEEGKKPFQPWVFRNAARRRFASPRVGTNAAQDPLESSSFTKAQRPAGLSRAGGQDAGVGVRRSPMTEEGHTAVGFPAGQSPDPCFGIGFLPNDASLP